MRAIWGRLALLLGAFTLVASVVVMVWGSDAAHRIPLNVDNMTFLEGTGSGLLAKSDTPVPITNSTHTQADPKASTDDVIAMQQVGCVVTGTEFCMDKDGKFVYSATAPEVVSISVAKYALLRDSGYPVEDQSKYIKDSTAVMPYEGLVTKFPFDTQKKDYQYWDSTLQTTVTATYVATKTIQGVETYQFDIVVPKTDAEIAEGTQGTYEGKQTLWVEPKTGAYIDQTVQQTVGTPDGTVVFDADLRYTSDTVKANAEDAKGNIRLLWILDVGVRWIAPVIGIALIVLSIFLLRSPRSKKSNEKHRELTTV